MHKGRRNAYQQISIGRNTRRASEMLNNSTDLVLSQADYTKSSPMINTVKEKRRLHQKNLSKLRKIEKLAMILDA